MPSPVRFAVVRNELESKNYSLVRINGSHHIFSKPNVPSQVVPVHRGMVKYVYYKKAKAAP
jgi:predicted RNA binding protein YcfA (HicA-like mRNA interferase family)